MDGPFQLIYFNHIISYCCIIIYISKMGDDTLVTFQRRRKGQRRAATAGSGEAEKENVPLGKVEDRNEKIIIEQTENPGAWWRGKGKGKKHRQHAMRVAHYLSMMKEQYAEIDAYELSAETPSPYQGNDMERSRGRSLDGASMTGRKTPSVFRRASLGLQDALGWLSRQGSLLKSARKPNTKRMEYSETPSKTMGTIAESDHDLDDEVKNILDDIQGKQKNPLVTPRLEDSFRAKLKIHSDITTPKMPHVSQLSPTEQLLCLCGQSTSEISMDALLGTHVDISTVKKVGEGTFGEAFRVGDVVFKIVAIEGEGDAQKTAAEILGEAAVSLTLSRLRHGSKNMTSGFVQTHGIGVCKGKYSKELAREWHRWDKIHSSENEPVDEYGDDQLYVVFVVENGGIDLEGFNPRSFKEIKSILLQSVITLAVAENACEFEHRDLHWGNILIQRDSSEQIGYLLNNVDVVAESAGVRATLIDFTLSRLTTKEGETAYCDLSSDPEIFKGPKGDPQAEAYRQMKNAVRDWKEYVPRTNAIWIDYLLDIMIHYKCPTNCNKAEKESLRTLQKDTARAASAEELLYHPFFAGMWSSS